MNVQINQLVKSLLQKDSLEQCSLEELEQFAGKNPYFGAAQLLLTKKLQTENAGRYQEQLQKTYLYFHNPLWVQQLLSDTGTGVIIPGEKVVLEDVKNTSLVNESFFSTPDSPPEQELINPALADNTPEKVDFNAPNTIISEPVEILVVEKKEDAVPTPSEKTGAPDLIFEPYYTVDYFASQGIKAREEDKPLDKFGQQLRSFTDWLKTMKRLPVAEIVKNVEFSAEKKVEQLAEHSLEEREVITEAMAEVWEKQGKWEKAIDIYNKLSLLEPSKSPYFAAKIKHLKKDN
jgi:hypothetical protein